MAGNRPRGRQKNVTGSGKSIYKRGSGLGTGPVGSSGGYSGRPSGGGIGGGSGRGSRGPRNTRGGGGLGKLIILGLIVLFGGGGGLGSMLFGGGSGDIVDVGEYGPTGSYGGGYAQQTGQSQQGGYANVDLSSMLGGLGGGSISSGWDIGSNLNQLDTTVAEGAREKYTEIIGNGKDEMTMMVYMCGTDLESRHWGDAAGRRVSHGAPVSGRTTGRR